MEKKLRNFFFHYNKPLSRKAQKPILSIHYNKKCLFVENIICKVPTKGKIRKTQPYFVLCGKTKEILIKDKIAYIL